MDHRNAPAGPTSRVLGVCGGKLAGGYSCQLAGIVLALGLLAASPLSAQNFSPYLETTGRGAHDQYRDTLLCSAVLEREIETAPDGARRSHLERGVLYTHNFALFMLATGNVVDGRGAILPADSLSVDRHDAQARWRAVLDEPGRDGATVEAEIVRCLGLYGHDWE